MMRDMLSDLLYRLRALFRRKRVEGELDEELRFHFEQQVEKNVARGMPYSEARRQARLVFGGLDQVKEECREARGVGFFDTAGQDLRYASRMLAKNPGFTAVAVLTLALGVGANSAVFSLVNAVLWRPLPYPEPDSLVAIGDRHPPGGSVYGRSSSRPVNFIHSAPDSPSLEGVAGMGFTQYVLRGGEPETLWTGRVTANFFDVLRVKMAVGRNFSEQEQQQRAPVILLSYELWQRRFGGRPDIVGEPIVLSDYYGDKPWTVIGVVPKDFWLPRATDIDLQLWTLYSHYEYFDDSFGWDPSVTIGRVTVESDLTAVTAELNTIKGRILAANGVTESNRVLVVKPLREEITDRFRVGLLLLLGAVGFVVLIACANLANLVLTRGIARRHELGVRAVVGATRSRLLRQLVTESCLLAVLGGFLGVLVAYGGVAFLRAIPFQQVPRLHEAAVDGTVVLFTLGLALTAGMLASLLPALRLSQVKLFGSLNTTASSAAVPIQRMRNTFVVAEIALAVVVVAGAGLMANTFLRLKAADLGFPADQVLVIHDLHEPPDLTLRDMPRTIHFYEEVLSALENLPGIESAGIIKYSPFLPSSYVMDFQIPGRSIATDESKLTASIVSPGYFRTTRIPLLRGRLLAESDDREAPKVAVIDETAAQRYWPGENPVGRIISLRHGKEWLPTEIVGVVDDIAQVGVRRDREPQIYVPYTQHYIGHMDAVLRTEAEPTSLAAAVRDVMRVVNKDQPLPTIQKLVESLEWEFAEPRFYMLLLSSFAGLAMLLAMVGLYGVISYSVSQRTQEFGIRIALGGQRSDVLRLVLRQAVWLVGIGLVLGVGGALALTRTLDHLLYEVEPTDPLTFLIVSLLLVLTALLACYVPARRATRIDPMRALRYE